jgi:hypothetical protein
MAELYLKGEITRTELEERVTSIVTNANVKER